MHQPAEHLPPQRPTPVRKVTIKEQVQEANDANYQAELSHPKKFSLWSIIGLAYAILNSWTANAASLSVALPSGGPSVVIWGVVISMVGNTAMALSLAEICHVYPTSGGQYHWAAVLSPPRHAPIISWITGWFSTAGWWALTATASSLAGQLITGAWALTHVGFEVQRYQIFIVYVGYTLVACFINVVAWRSHATISSFAITWSIAGALLICIVCLACSSPNYQSASFVFTAVKNETGWTTGVAWIIGILQGCYGVAGYDSISHMVEEIPRPSINAPKAIVLSVLIGSVSSLIFLVVLLFCITDVDEVISSSAGALLAAIYQGTGRSTVGAICLQVFPIISMATAAQGLMMASSRMTHAFARDGGLPFSPLFSRMDPKSNVPQNGVYLTTGLVILVGCIYLGSNSALQAILSASVVFLNVSFAIPVGLLLFRGRHLLDPPSFPERTMSLGKVWGPVCNVVGLVFTVFTTVFFLFPPDVPTTGSNMNYAIVVLFIIFLVASSTWFFQGRHTFVGPRNLAGLLELARIETAPAAFKRRFSSKEIKGGRFGEDDDDDEA